MENYSDKAPDWDNLRLKIIGLGESSIRKNYYPELHERLEELEETNSNLNELIEELQCKEEEANKNYKELMEVQASFSLARKKLSLLNTLTFQDIQNALFSLHGYLTLINEKTSVENDPDFLEKSLDQVKKIGRTLNIAKQYQEMGIHPPIWNNVLEVFLFAISRLNFTNFSREIKLEGLSIYADPLFEEVLYYIMENIIEHGENATRYLVYYEKTDEGLNLVIEDNGIGIEDFRKILIFERDSSVTNGLGLFLVRELLSITDIRIIEDGVYQKGARFVLIIPEGRYKFVTENNQCK